MDREQAVKYLQSSGFSEEQIKAIEGAFTCDKCVYSTNEGCQYDDITETIPPVTPQPKSECEHDHEILKAYSDGASAVLDKVRTEIMNLQTYKMFEGEDAVYVERENVLQIIDEFTAEGSEA